MTEIRLRIGFIPLRDAALGRRKSLEGPLVVVTSL
jgi:hypothetical protein